MIKFKAWDKKSKKMREVDSIAFHNKRGAFGFNDSLLPKVVNLWGRNPIEGEDIIVHREAKDVILRRFTGLIDKNGKEIYEGDVLRWASVPTIRFTWKVDYLDKEALFFGTSLDGYSGGPLAALGGEDGFEVIGNIHENPELLT